MSLFTYVLDMLSFPNMFLNSATLTLYNLGTAADPPTRLMYMQNDILGHYQLFFIHVRLMLLHEWYIQSSQSVLRQ